MDLQNFEELHADHIMRNILGDGEPPSLPDDSTEKDIKQRKPDMDWSKWRNDAAYRSQVAFENTYKELGVPESVECDSSITYHLTSIV